MTPKEKAQNLFEKMLGQCASDNGQQALALSKQCAIIAVDLILIDCGANDWGPDQEADGRNYWQEVRKEIEKYNTMTNLRKVVFKKWIPAVIEKTETGSSKIKSGTNCWEDGFSRTGLFHQWGICFEQSDDGSIGNYSVALVEVIGGTVFDGQIEEVLPKNLKFINSSNKQ